tara:strand:- start:509 stop:2413 length:1905 start_codon:yes stop_codon:yes gene_type:complete
MPKKIRKNLLKIIKYLLNQSRSTKTSLLIFVDYFLLVLCFELALSIRINDWFFPVMQSSRLLIFLTPILALPIFYFCGLYQSFTRYTSLHSLRVVIFGISLYTIVWFLIVLIPNLIIKPYDFLIINWLLTIFFIGGVRFIYRPILSVNSNRDKSKNVIIYGAGYSGTRLASALNTDSSIKLVGYIDDDTDKQGLYIEGIKVYKRELLAKLINKKNVDEILLAMPSVPRSQVSNIVKYLTQYSVLLKTMPDMLDLMEGKVSFSNLRKIRIEDLLNRDVREPDNNLLAKDIINQNILVTGAGGSIGGELCKQIIKLQPKSLLLFDIAEYSLYKIERNLLEEEINFPLLTIIGNVTNQSRLERIFSKYNIDTVYHSAAYKHVPLVEKNTIAGLRCNIFGTLACCKAALNSNVKSFVFISTDKAVRPTNIMGATKRFAEMILQALAIQSKEKDNINTRISIVRFGNVLGSSGSVVPLFKEQIKKGGPITITDPNIIRYFMTIQEASELVIQAGAIGENGEIFHLDMGEPKKILDLAKDMIQLSGMSLRDDNNPNGDIEISYIGLRPGEKLFEELLIDSKSVPTQHPKIMQAMDKGLDWKVLKGYLQRFEEAIIEEQYQEIIDILVISVDGFKPQVSNN